MVHRLASGFTADDITRSVADMYTRYPYPSASRHEGRLVELANLLRLFAAETQYDFRGKSVLDVGTGTGHRIIAAARALPDTRFTAVDLCAAPLNIARAAADEAGVSNITFREHDLLASDEDLGRFDVVLCMGVLHHLPDPALGLRRLAKLVADDGLLFAYVYGALGSAERMRRKELLATLLGSDRGDFDAGLTMARSLGFAADNFGWNRNADDVRSADALMVDSYLNVNERLFDMHGVQDLMPGTGLDSLMAFGITTGARGYLVDTALQSRAHPAVPWTDMATTLPTPGARAAYERLSLAEKYRVIELAYLPNGYTLLAFRRAAGRHFSEGGRIRRNALDAG